MAPMRMSWRTDLSRLASEWLESETTESYNPAWMQSSCPNEASVRRSSPNQSTLINIIVTIREALVVLSRNHDAGSILAPEAPKCGYRLTARDPVWSKNWVCGLFDCG